MTIAVKEIIDAAERLSEEERAEIATHLMSSLDGPIPSPQEQAEIDAAWEIEIARRIKEVDEGTVQLVDGDEVYRNLRAGRRP